MKEIDFISMNKKRYDEIIGCVRELTSQRFCYLNLSDDIANTILVKLMKSTAFAEPMGISADLIKSAFPKAVEDVFNYYQKVSYQYCYAKTNDHTLSEDTSQEAIRQLLSSNRRIKYPYYWLRQVTLNLLCKYYEHRAKEREVLERLNRETSVIQSFVSPDHNIEIDGLQPSQKQEIIESQEYKEYEQAISFKSTKEYAEWLQVSDKVAQKRKEKAIRDLKAKILLAMGWEASREILNFNQYNAIQKFIRHLLKLGRGSDESAEPRWDARLKQAMQGIERIDDWGITMVANCRFRLHVFHLTQDKRPLAATFFIVLDERNHITIENSVQHKNIISHPIPANVQIPKEMGKSMWTYDKIISLLNA
jgi:DNA-directed RNA polymerase specialized sigma24 family protein